MNKNLKDDSVYLIVSKTQLNSFERKVITNLYQPIMGYPALSLYLTLASEVDYFNNVSSKSYISRLVNIMNIDLKLLSSSLTILEALALVNTYYNENEDTYLFNLNSPLSPDKFFHNPLLNNKLLNALGKTNYQKTKQLYLDSSLNTNEYKEISASFKDVFSGNSNPLYQNTDQRFIDFKEANIHNKDVDFNLLKEKLKKYKLQFLLNDKAIRAHIEAMYYAFDITDAELIEGIIESYQDKHLDLKMLNHYCKQISEYKRYTTELNLVYLEDKNATNKYQRYSVVAFVSKFFKNINIQKYLIDIENIMKENNLSTEVTNALIEFIINELGYFYINYFSKTALTLKKRGIISLTQALNYLNDVHDVRANPNKNKKNNNKRVIGSKTSWNANEEEEVSDEELEKLKEEMKGW
ncbi:MAG: hypothetical protein LBR40_03990 [Bacilli bacterium]|jgi:replication initiation and membrane attachment protein|nr:hypothetical protein [Bacilli bacterium]